MIFSKVLVIGADPTELHIQDFMLMNPNVMTLSAHHGAIDGDNHHQMDFNRSADWIQLKSKLGDTKFDIIVFDWSVTKFIEMDGWKNTYGFLHDLLNTGGELYIDTTTIIGGLRGFNLTSYNSGDLKRSELSEQCFISAEIDQMLSIISLCTHPATFEKKKIVRTPDQYTFHTYFDDNTIITEHISITNKTTVTNIVKYVIDNMKPDIYIDKYRCIDVALEHLLSMQLFKSYSMNGATFYHPTELSFFAVYYELQQSFMAMDIGIIYDNLVKCNGSYNPLISHANTISGDFLVVWADSIINHVYQFTRDAVAIWNRNFMKTLFSRVDRCTCDYILINPSHDVRDYFHCIR